MTMVECPDCHDGSGVQIALNSRPGATARWTATCGGCGGSWDLDA